MRKLRWPQFRVGRPLSFICGHETARMGVNLRKHNRTERMFNQSIIWLRDQRGTQKGKEIKERGEEIFHSEAAKKCKQCEHNFNVTRSFGRGLHRSIISMQAPPSPPSSRKEIDDRGQTNRQTDRHRQYNDGLLSDFLKFSAPLQKVKLLANDQSI